MSDWKPVDQDVFDDSLVQNIWTDLDISSIVGSNCCFVHIGVKVRDSSGGARFKMRGKGQTSQDFPGDSSHHGINYHFASLYEWTTLTAVTNDSGVLQMVSGSSNRYFTIRLFGYCILERPGDVRIETDLDLDGNGWLSKDISSEMGSLPGIAFLSYKSTSFGGGVPQSVRAKSDSYDWLNAGAQGTNDNTATPYTGNQFAVQIEESDGIYRHAMSASSSPLIQAWFDGGINTPDVTIVNQEIDDDFLLSSNDWKDLDLSAYVSGRALVRLRVEHGLTGTSNPDVSLRRKGETRNLKRAANSKSVGTHELSYGPAIPGIMHGETNEDGIIEVWSSTLTSAQSMKVELVDFIQENPKPEIDSVVHTYLNLRVNFNIPMIDDTELRDPSNYNITVTDPTTAYDFEALLVTPESGVTNPTYVDLTMTDCTGGKEYTLVITPDKLQSESLLLLEAGKNTAVFTGVTEDPDVLTAESISLTQIRVTFSKTMAVNEEFKNPSNYSLTGGLQVRAVDVESESTVLLTTTEQTPGQLYDITVS
jgi:hypothetical protein